jgi:hypothetical protein
VPKLTPTQTMDLKKKMEELRKVVVKPQQLTDAQKLARYNIALATANCKNRLDTIPQPSVTLTPASPRSPKANSFLHFECYNNKGWWDCCSAHYPEGYICIPNEKEKSYGGSLGVQFETIPGRTYLVEIQTVVNSPSPKAAWSIFKADECSNLTLSANTSPIILGFVAKTVNTGFQLQYIPNASNGSVVNDIAIFLGCKLTLV